ncbi:hypothetical protein HWV62_11475 [Athelia sp. TMB]|nr:hypothetical protein HWV62_11475 [Athelia sp. TMB]
MFALLPPHGESGDETKEGLHVLPVKETALVLESILRLCHPASIRKPPVLELDAIKRVYLATKKYGMEEVEKIVRSALVSPRFLAASSLRSFGIACALRLAAEARIAATATLAISVEDWEKYLLDLEKMSGADTFHLQEYHRRCSKAALNIARGDVPKTLGEGFIWRVCRTDSSICPVTDGPGFRGLKWWIDGCLLPCCRNLEKKPTGKSVEEDEMFSAALRKAQICPECNERSFVDLKKYAPLFGKAIDEAVAKVVLSFHLKLQ